MSSEVKLFRLSGSAPVIDMRTGHNATLRPGLVVLSEDAHTHAMAALEAENARLTAQLAAIQGGMVEVVEVPGDLAERSREILDWQKSGVLTGDALRRFAAGKRYAGDHNELQIAEADTAREAYRAVLDYQRITATMAAEVAELKDSMTYRTSLVGRLEAERDALRAELAEVKGREAAWLPIETAPCDGRMALVYRPLARNSKDEPVAVKRLIGGNNHCWESTVPDGATPTNPTDGSCHVTHWMPFPQPPETALSTWRQAHTPSTLPASAAEE